MSRSGRQHHRHASGANHFGRVLSRGDWSPGADQFVFTAKRPPMHRRGPCCGGAERRPLRRRSVTYPFIKDIAARLGVRWCR